MLSPFEPKLLVGADPMVDVQYARITKFTPYSGQRYCSHSCNVDVYVLRRDFGCLESFISDMFYVNFASKLSYFNKKIIRSLKFSLARDTVHIVYALWNPVRGQQCSGEQWNLVLVKNT
jgi:hypothetical protein